MQWTPDKSKLHRDTQRQFLESVCSEDDLRSRIFGTFVVKLLEAEKKSSNKTF